MDGTLWSVSVSVFLSSFITLSWFPLYSYVIVNMLVQDEALESHSILIHFKFHYSKFFKDAAERSEILCAQWNVTMLLQKIKHWTQSHSVKTYISCNILCFGGNVGRCKIVMLSTYKCILTTTIAAFLGAKGWFNVLGHS